MKNDKKKSYFSTSSRDITEESNVSVEQPDTDVVEDIVVKKKDEKVGSQSEYRVETYIVACAENQTVSMTFKNGDVINVVRVKGKLLPKKFESVIQSGLLKKQGDAS